MVPTFIRQRLLVDPSFQLRLVFLMGGYLLLWTTVVFHVYFLFFAIWNLADATVRKGVFALYIEFVSEEELVLITLLLVAPVVAYEMFKFSHRIAGPLYRCRQLMREMAAGKTVAEFQPRRHDLLGDFFRDFNALIREWNEQVNTKQNGRSDNLSKESKTEVVNSAAANNVLPEPVTCATN
jgi:hypothetical protein